MGVMSAHLKMLYIDFETRSSCDLKKHGVYNYAQDASTEVLCMSYAFDDEDVQTWLPGQPLPDFTGQMIYAHNAAFERLIFWYVLQINIPLEKFYCTATQSRANCAPGSLEDAGRFAGAGMRKDHKGAALVRKFCIPPFSQDDPHELIAYCEQDVRAMRAISQAMRPLSDEELADYHVSERINDRGVLVDVPLARAAMQYAAAETLEIQALVHELTGITSVRSIKTRDWVMERVSPEARKLMVKDDKASIDKTVRAALLAMPDLPPLVADVVQCLDDLSASSVAKFSRMADLADVEDSRVRGAFVFAGGAATGRAASYGIQFQNMARKVAKDPETLRQTMVRGHKLEGTVTAALKSMIRPAIIAAPGKVFINFDWSAIEARVLPWLSGNGEATLDVFRRGEDLYVANAKKMFNVVEVSPDQRQQAKISVLACGFGGGVGAFGAMARMYGLHMPETEAQRMVDLWRKANPWAQPMWRLAEDTYRRAMRNPGQEFSANRVVYLYDKKHLWFCLPSGRILCYPHARFDADGGISYAKSSWKPAQDAKEWPRSTLWHGLAVQSCTQAVAHDVLRYALRQLESEGIATVAHVHDEILVECAENEAISIQKRMKEIMCTSPIWASDLPLAVDGSVSKRYS